MLPSSSGTHMIAGISQAEIIVPSTTDEIKKLREGNEPWQRGGAKFWAKLIAIIPKAINLTL